MDLLISLVFAVVAPAALATAAPAPAASAAPLPTFAGVTLGEPAAQLVAQRGEPMMAPTSGENGMWFYFSPGGGSMELIGIRRGYVSGVSVAGNKADASVREDISMDGVHLGGPFSEVPSDAATGAVITVDGIDYTFKPSNDRKTVVSVAAHLPAETIAKLPAVTHMPLLHDGSSLREAVVVRVRNAQLSNAFEDGYMTGHDSCVPGKWKLLKRSHIHANKKSYDVVNVGCDDSNDTKTVYFDVTGIPPAP